MVFGKKILSEFFDDIILGSKTFEIRRDKDNIQPGDLLFLHEIEDGCLTGRFLCCVVTGVFRGFKAIKYGVRPGYCIISFKVKFIIGGVR